MTNSLSRTLHFEDSLEESKEYLKKAIAFLSKHKISPNPVNYIIGYEYAAQRDDELVKALEKRSRRTGEVDGHMLFDLFEEFYLLDPNLDFENHLHGLQQMLSRMVNEVAQVSEGVDAYGNTLDDSLDKLKTNPSTQVIEDVVRGLVKATEKAAVNNQTLQSHLEETRSETSLLREELEKVRQESQLDSLTGLFNRKMLTTTLEDRIVESQQSGEPLSLLMFDIDHFKKFNDNFGHLIGDEVIRRVAGSLRKHIRGTDLAARFGGEEFTVVLPDTDLEGAVTVAKTIHSAISKLSLVKKSTQERLPGITVSVGASVLSLKDSSESLIERADQALYQAKEAGRNRIVTEKEISDSIVGLRGSADTFEAEFVDQAS